VLDNGFSFQLAILLPNIRLWDQGQGYRTRKGRKCLFMHRSTSISNFIQYSPDGATDHASQVVAPYIRRHCCYL